MAKLIGDFHKTLHELGVSYKDAIKLDEIKEGEKISIMSDSMFKTMFQNENRIKYSAKLISYYIDIPFNVLVKNIKLCKNELDKEKEKDRKERCDYVAIIDDTSINIEVNNNGSLKTLERNMEYGFRLYSRLIKSGKNKDQYTQVIQFNLNNFSFNGNNKVSDIYSVQNDDEIRYNDKLIFVQIYIPNLIRKWYTNGIQKLDESEKYLLALVLRDVNDSKEIGKGIDIMEEYINEAEYVTLEGDLKESYDKEWALKDLGEQQGYIDGHEIGLTEGKEAGLKEGKEAGLKEGKEAGLKEGMKLGFENGLKQVVLKMKEAGLDSEIISKITNLSEENINLLK